MENTTLSFSEQPDLAQRLLMIGQWDLYSVKGLLRDSIKRLKKVTPVSNESTGSLRPKKGARMYLFEHDQKTYLTEREHQCLSLIFEGNTQVVVAEKLGLSPRTVEYYLKNVKQRWEVQTLADIHQRLTVSELVGHATT